MQMQPPITLTRPDRELLENLLKKAGDKVRHLFLERLEDELGRARVIEPSAAHGIVTLGDRGVYDNLESGQRREVVLVPPDEARAGTELLSVLSPIGCSLIGLKQGDIFVWDDGPKRWRLQVISVKSERASLGSGGSQRAREDGA